MKPFDANLPIGLFDSGVGGLTVLSELKKRLPNENYLYLGDTARVPYGTKTRATVVRYSLEAAEELVRRGIKMLVIACNTATTALPELKQSFPDLPIIGVIEPGARAAVAASVTRNIVVLATESTISNRAYHNAITALAPGARVTGIPCSLLVALAEEGWAGELGISSDADSGADPEITPAARSIAENVVARYLSSVYPHLLNQVNSAKERTNDLHEINGIDEPDCIVLGCTHFPPFAPAVQGLVGKKVTLVNSAVATANVVADALAERHMMNTSSKRGCIHLLATDGAARFTRVGSLFLEQAIAQDAVEIVTLASA